MSKTPQRTIKYTPSNTLPKLKQIQTTWDLKRHYYKSEKDPQIEKDLKKVERAYTAFAKKYSKKNFTASSKTLLAALKDYDKLISMAVAGKPGMYFGYRRALNTADSVAEKQENLIGNRMTKTANQLLFFELAIGSIPKKTQKIYLADERLLKYRYYLQQVFEEASHMLSEPEERILSLKSTTSSHMWVSGTEKILSNKTLMWKKKEYAFPEATEMLNTLPPAERPKLWSKLLEVLEDVAPIAENEFNAIVTNKKVNDELRGYKEPYSATIQAYENKERSVLALIEAVSTKGFALSKKFYKLKAKYHKKTSLSYANKYDPIGTGFVIPFKEAVEICRDAFYSVKNEYGAIFDTMLQNGHLDVYPRRGKRGGAFMSGDIGKPTFVFLNQTNDFQSLETLAHEMGHAIHGERSKKQPALYEDFSIVTAETASTLFEQIAGNAIIAQAAPRDRLSLLHDRIMRDISTIQRQIAFFNFELDMHRAVREHGALTQNELQNMMTKHLKSYLGPAVDVTQRDGLSFVYVPHFRYGFYVYSYAYGILVSSIMARRLAEDPGYDKEIDQFLTSGGKDTVENIFSSIGIDTLRVKTFEESLDSLRRDIDTFARLI